MSVFFQGKLFHFVVDFRRKLPRKLSEFVVDFRRKRRLGLIRKIKLTPIGQPTLSRNASKSGTESCINFEKIFSQNRLSSLGSSEVYDKTTRQKNRHFFGKIVFCNFLSTFECNSFLEICFHVCSKAVWHLISKKNEKPGRSRRGAKLKLLRRGARSLRFLIILSYAVARLMRIASSIFQTNHFRRKVVPC